MKPQKPIEHQDWAIVADTFVKDMEAEHAASPKSFYNLNSGTARAKRAIASLDSFRLRLQPFVRA